MDTSTSISGLVVEYIVAMDVTRVRFPADAIYYDLYLSPRWGEKKVIALSTSDLGLRLTGNGLGNRGL